MLDGTKYKIVYDKDRNQIIVPIIDIGEKMKYGMKNDEFMEKVGAPSHYIEGREYEPHLVIEDWELNFNLGNAIKYISRAGRKGDAIEDLLKAKQYLQFEIERLKRTESQENHGS